MSSLYKMDTFAKAAYFPGANQVAEHFLSRIVSWVIGESFIHPRDFTPDSSVSSTGPTSGRVPVLSNRFPQMVSGADRKIT